MREFGSAVAAAIALLLALGSGCDRIPPEGLFGPGSVDETQFAARRMGYLEYATGSVGTGSPLNAIAHMERELRDPGYVAPLGAWGPNAWDATFTKMSTFEDTSDFDALYLLNALLGYRDHPNAVVAPELWQKTEDALLAFKFWYQQPTPDGIIDDMWYWSENHQIIFHSVEYLLGQTYPDRVFTTTGMTGAEHRAHAKAKIERWLDHKARFGFDEWHSNVYYQKDVTPLLTLVEYADEPEIATRAAMLLDRVLLDIAIHHYKGNFGSTHGRSYKKDKMTGLHDDTYGLSKLLFDESPAGYTSTGDPGATLLARAQKYRLPRLVYDVAKTDVPFVDKERMGIPLDELAPLPAEVDETGAYPPPPAPYGFDYRDEENIFIYWSMSALTAWPVLPMVWDVANAYNLWETELFQPFAEILQAVGSLSFAQTAAAALAHAASAGQLEEVNTYTYRTADYMLSTAQDYRKGSRGNQYHSWQATFGLDAIVFTTHPGSRPAESLPEEPPPDWSVDREPGSWTGTASQPRSAQHENVGIHLYAPQYTVVPTAPFDALTRYEPYTHAYFPQDHFDEVVRDGNWTFGRKDGGYVALYSWRVAEFVDHGPTVATNGMTLPFDLVASGGPSNVWIVECGSESDWGSFAAFQDAIRDAAVVVVERTTNLPPRTRGPIHDVSYESPSQGPMTFSWAGPLTVGGVEVPIANYPRMENPWTRIEFESKDLLLEDRVNGTAIWHDFEGGGRFLFDLD